MASSSWPLLRLGFAAIVSMMLFEGSFVGVSPGDLAASDGILTQQEAVSAQQARQRGLLGLWHLDGNTNDDSGAGHHGVLVGAPTVIPDGVAGQAYHFSGSDAIDAGNLIFPREQYTVSVWIRTTEPAIEAVWRMAIAKGNDPSGNQTFELFLADGRIGVGEDAPTLIIWGSGMSLTPGTGIYAITAESSQINGRDGNWHMVTATYASGSQRLYVDGCLAGLSTYAGPLPLVEDGVLIGGFSFGPYHHPWIGDLDEVSIYSRVLSAAEVGRSYKRHRPARRCP